MDTTTFSLYASVSLLYIPYQALKCAWYCRCTHSKNACLNGFPRNIKLGHPRAVASGPASPVLAGLLSAIGNFAKDSDTLIEQSVYYFNRTVMYVPPI